MTLSALQRYEPFLQRLSEDPGLGHNRFVARNFRLDEILPPRRVERYAGEVLPAPDFSDWQLKHGEYVKKRLIRKGTVTGPPTALNRTDPQRCPETFGEETIPVSNAPIAEDLSLIRMVAVAKVAESIGLDEESVLDSLRDEALRDGVIKRWVLKLPVIPVFAAFWQDLRDLLPSKGPQPTGWADDLRDRLGLTSYDPARWGPINVMVLRYPVTALPTIDDGMGRALAIPTELDGDFSPPFCPAPTGSGVGRVVDLGQEPSLLRREVLHPPVRWEGRHLIALGVVSRPVPALEPARKRHLRLVRAVSNRNDYGLDTDGS